MCCFPNLKWTCTDVAANYGGHFRDIKLHVLFSHISRLSLVLQWCYRCYRGSWTSWQNLRCIKVSVPSQEYNILCTRSRLLSSSQPSIYVDSNAPSCVRGGSKQQLCFFQTLWLEKQRHGRQAHSSWTEDVGIWLDLSPSLIAQGLAVLLHFLCTYLDSCSRVDVILLGH